MAGQAEWNIIITADDYSIHALRQLARCQQMSAPRGYQRSNCSVWYHLGTYLLPAPTMASTKVKGGGDDGVALAQNLGLVASREHSHMVFSHSRDVS